MTFLNNSKLENLLNKNIIKCIVINIKVSNFLHNCNKSNLVLYLFNNNQIKRNKARLINQMNNGMKKLRDFQNKKW